jgi:hypothetical protein
VGCAFKINASWNADYADFFGLPRIASLELRDGKTLFQSIHPRSIRQIRVIRV